MRGNCIVFFQSLEGISMSCTIIVSNITGLPLIAYPRLSTIGNCKLDILISDASAYYNIVYSFASDFNTNIETMRF